MIEAPTNEFLAIAAAVGAATFFGVYMAARPHKRSDAMAGGPIITDDDLFSEKRISDAAARAKKDAVLAEVSEGSADWMSDAILAALRLPDGELGTGEDIRARLIEDGLRPPRHPNVWGALFRALGRREILAETGEYRAMRTGSSHGRRSPVYIKMPGAA